MQSWRETGTPAQRKQITLPTGYLVDNNNNWLDGGRMAYHAWRRDDPSRVEGNSWVKVKTARSDQLESFMQTAARRRHGILAGPYQRPTRREEC